MLFLVAAALPGAAHGQDAEYPAGEVLAAFATACSGVENTAVNLASAQAAGWERLAADADTPITRLVQQGKDALAASVAAENGAMPEQLGGAEFRKVVADRTLYLAISGLMIGDMATRGCRLYDFDAPRGLTAEELEQWAVRAPNDRQELPTGISRATFNPGLKPGHMEMEAYFVPPGTEPLPGIDLQGIGLVATAIEFVP